MSLLVPSVVAAKDISRPGSVVYVRKYRGAPNLFYQPVWYGPRRWLTKTPHTPTALQCTADGKFIVYAEDGKIYATPLQAGAPRQELQKLPDTIWQIYRFRLRNFVRLSPSGRYVALPHAKGVVVHDLSAGKSRLIVPPAPREVDSASKIRVVHPARWLPGHDSFGYLTLPRHEGRGQVVLRLYDVIQGRQTLWFPVLKQKVDAVEGFDLAWSPNGNNVAVSLSVRRGKRKSTVLRIFALNPHRRLLLPRRFKVSRLHGWDGKYGDLIFRARVGRGPAKLWSYSFRRRKSRLRAIGWLGNYRMGLSFHPTRRSVLVAEEVPTRCSGRSRLLSAGMHFRMRSLVKWARWAELVALDPTKTWGIFRAAGACYHKRPILLLSTVDGLGWRKKLPHRFHPLRTITPQEVTLCPYNTRPPRAAVRSWLRWQNRLWKQRQARQRQRRGKRRGRPRRRKPRKRR